MPNLLLVCPVGAEDIGMTPNRKRRNSRARKSGQRGGRKPRAGSLKG